MTEQPDSKVLAQIDEIADRFEEAWRAGAAPCLVDFLSEVDELHRPQLMRELQNVQWQLEDAVADTSGLPATTDSLIEHPGLSIGPYKLLEKIGEGGFGVVFLAEQQHPVRRKVAIKVIKPGMDTRQVIARFEAERQALALMEHPNIARVLDAGEAASGRPYFVMELVRGVPITQHCDKHHLSIRDRLQLLTAVCSAVQHAHQKGVIHRDLKPSNVLVTLQNDVPMVKVIDFGVAKATGQQLTEKTLFTAGGQILGTPLYMSPEQAGLNGFDVDTRSDVYSLGVMLYELLTGTTPLVRETLQKAAFDEVCRLIRESDAERPSARIGRPDTDAATISSNFQLEPGQLQRLLRNELDWIAMRALEKDRARRYDSASSLGRDIERYLQDEPVEACPPSAGYLLRKLIRRNKQSLVVLAFFPAAIVLAGWIVAIAVRAEQFANALVVVVVYLPLLLATFAALTFGTIYSIVGGGWLVTWIWKSQRSAQSKDTFIVGSIGNEYFTGPVEKVHFTSPVVDNLPPGFATKFALEHTRRKAVTGFFLGVLVCSGVLAASAGVAVSNPALQSLGAARWPIVFTPILSAAAAFLALGLTQAIFCGRK